MTAVRTLRSGPASTTGVCGIHQRRVPAFVCHVHRHSGIDQHVHDLIAPPLPGRLKRRRPLGPPDTRGGVVLEEQANELDASVPGGLDEEFLYARSIHTCARAERRAWPAPRAARSNTS